jgi:hypothetical protein
MFLPDIKPGHTAYSKSSSNLLVMYEGTGTIFTIKKQER